MAAELGGAPARPRILVRNRPLSDNGTMVGVKQPIRASLTPLAVPMSLAAVVAVPECPSRAEMVADDRGHLGRGEHLRRVPAIATPYDRPLAPPGTPLAKGRRRLAEVYRGGISPWD